MKVIKMIPIVSTFLLTLTAAGSLWATDKVSCKWSGTVVNENKIIKPICTNDAMKLYLAIYQPAVTGTFTKSNNDYTCTFKGDLVLKLDKDSCTDNKFTDIFRLLKATVTTGTSAQILETTVTPTVTPTVAPTETMTKYRKGEAQ